MGFRHSPTDNRWCVRLAHLLLPPGHVSGLLGVERISNASEHKHINLQFNFPLLFLLLDPLSLLPILLFTCAAVVFRAFARSASRGGGLSQLAARSAAIHPFPRRGGAQFSRSLRCNFLVGLPARVFAGGRVQHGSTPLHSDGANRKVHQVFEQHFVCFSRRGVDSCRLDL